MGSFNSGVCSQCSQSANTVNLVELNHGYICEPCLRSIYGQVFGDQYQSLSDSLPKVAASGFTHSPKRIVAYLDQYIVGQHEAKRAIAVAIYNHIKRLALIEEGEVIDKTNILIVGDTGTGKTLLVRTIAQLIDVPFVIADATSMVQSGYAGENVEECVKRLFIQSNHDISATQSGIIFVDEIDKIAKKAGTVGRDIAGEGVQQQLLKLIEGKEVLVESKIRGQLVKTLIDTSNILFISGGAFAGSNKEVGTVQDIIEYGLMPEVVGRMPTLIKLSPHTVESLVAILTEPKNSIIEQTQKLLAVDGVDLKFDKKSLAAIAEIAIKRGTGARGLKGILEEVVEPITYDIEEYRAQKSVSITEEDIRGVFSFTV